MPTNRFIIMIDNASVARKNQMWTASYLLANMSIHMPIHIGGQKQILTKACMVYPTCIDMCIGICIHMCMGVCIDMCRRDKPDVELATYIFAASSPTPSISDMLKSPRNPSLNP